MLMWDFFYLLIVVGGKYKLAVGNPNYFRSTRFIIGSFYTSSVFWGVTPLFALFLWWLLIKKYV